MRNGNLPTIVFLTLCLFCASGCQTLSKLETPRTEAEKIEFNFLVRSYEAEGLSTSSAISKALQEFNKKEESKEENGPRLWPKDPSDRIHVKKLSEKYEDKGYDSATACKKALDEWRWKGKG